MDLSMTAVMRGVSEALRLDGENKLQDAYTKYVECVLRITTKLLQDVRNKGGQVNIDKEVFKFVRLGQQCMDRVSIVVNQLGNSADPRGSKNLPPKPPDGSQVTTSAGTTSSNTSEPQTPPDSSNFQLRPRGFSDPVPPLPDNPTTITYKKQKNLTPMELAYKQNQQLMRAYKARIAKLNAKSATSLSLTIQRKISENIAIAKAQEDALAKKMKERQQRLEELAIKKFGQSDKEQKEVYKKVMEYEQDSKWLTGLRKELEENPTDSVIIEKVIQAVLSCVDHPLTEKLKAYQYKVYSRLYPLVSNKTEDINQVRVPLNPELWPTCDSQKSEESEQSLRHQKSDRKEEECDENTGDKSSRTELEESLPDSEGAEDRKGPREERFESISDIEDEAGHRCSSVRQDSEGQGQKESEGQGQTDDSQGHLTDFSNEAGDQPQDEHNLDNIGSETDLEKVIKEVVESSDDESDGVKDDSSEKNLGDIAQDTKDNLKEAIDRGEHLTVKLTAENTETKRLCSKISKDYERYSMENMDDLFDNESDDGEDNSDQQEIIHSSETNKSDLLNSGSLPSDKSDISEVDQSDSATENSDGQFCNSVSKEIQSPSDSDKGSFPPDMSKIQEMKKEAYNRHLKGISEDLQNYLDRLMSLFIGAYEQLNTPEGRDNCYSLLEEPFYRPLWEYLLWLFRLANRPKEIALAYVMTRRQVCSPGDFGVIKKLQLEAQDKGVSVFPYKPAVQELQSLIQKCSLLGKLECLVRSSRLICQCIEDYYNNGDRRGKTPSLGADDLLPILCYVIVKTGLPQIISECHIMEEFIHEGYIMGEEGYCLTSMQTALGYLATLGSKKIHSTSIL